MYAVAEGSTFHGWEQEKTPFFSVFGLLDCCRGKGFRRVFLFLFVSPSFSHMIGHAHYDHFHFFYRASV